jgi:hypothetical protein
VPTNTSPPHVVPARAVERHAHDARPERRRVVRRALGHHRRHVRLVVLHGHHRASVRLGLLAGEAFR